MLLRSIFLQFENRSWKLSLLWGRQRRYYCSGNVKAVPSVWSVSSVYWRNFPQKSLQSLILLRNFADFNKQHCNCSQQKWYNCSTWWLGLYLTRSPWRQVSFEGFFNGELTYWITHTHTPSRLVWCDIFVSRKAMKDYSVHFRLSSTLEFEGQKTEKAEKVK